MISASTSATLFLFHAALIMLQIGATSSPPANPKHPPSEFPIDADTKLRCILTMMRLSSFVMACACGYFRVVTSSSVVAPANLSQSEYKQWLVASSISASDALSSMGVGFGGVGSEANLSERLQMREKKNAQASADPRKQELPPRWQPDPESEPRHAT